MRTILTLTDEAAIDHLHAKFGHMWFGCQESDLSKDRLKELVSKGLLDSSQESGTRNVYFRVHP